MTLLADAPSGRHLAQFHRDADALAESGGVFLAAGLRRGHALLVIAAGDRTELLLDRLSASKFDPHALRNSGQLAIMDAGKVVEQCMADGMPEWTRFRAALMPMLSRIQPAGHGTRIYSEIAGLLWHDGNTAGAIRFEEFWNALAVNHQFALFCGFTMDTHSEEAYAAPLEELGRTHSDILGGPEDEEFGAALDRASRDLFGVSLSQMAGITRHDGARRFPTGQRTMLWVKRNLPMSTAQLADRARQYFREPPRLNP